MNQKTSAKICTLFAACLMLIVSQLVATAQSKQPNLTGTWKMNSEKSQFERGGPNGITIKFDHNGSSLSEAMFLETQGGDRTVELKYTTDGKQTNQDNLMGAAGQSLVKWEGETLLINWSVGDMSFNRKVTLSADGKTMTMIVMQTSQDGSQSTDTVVLEKQQAVK